MSIRYTHDMAGRPYAKLSELKEGSLIDIDGGFTCVPALIRVAVRQDKKGRLYFDCDEGHHLLCGQADEGEHLIGIYHSA